MVSTAGSTRGNLDRPLRPELVPDVQGVLLAEVADRVADADDPVARVVQRFMDSMESPSRVPITMFNSAI